MKETCPLATHRNAVTGGLLILLLLGVVACAASRPGAALNNLGNLAKLGDDAFVHHVRWQGETMSIIAKWYTGRAANWKKLANANARLNPERLEQGYRVLIPRPLLITTAAMPEDFVRKFYRQPASLRSAEKDAIVPFGPKE